MLVLSRKVGETVLIGDTEVHVLRINGRVRLGIDAPSKVPVRRGELNLPGSGDQADHSQVTFKSPETRSAA